MSYIPNSIDNNSIVFFTHAPQGTLGDPSAAAKLIGGLKAQYGDRLTVNIILIVPEYQHVAAVSNIFEKLDVNAIIINRFNLTYKGKNTKGLDVDVNAVIQESNGIIFFPTFHHFQSEQISLVKKYNKPSFVVTEYDLHTNNKKEQLKKLGDFKASCMEIETGVGHDKLGIFCTDEPAYKTTALKASALSSITGQDHQFKQLLLNGGNAQNYFETHQLFFGYLNKLNMELRGHKADASLFIKACLGMIDSEKKVIDIILPLQISADKDRRFKSVEEVLALFDEKPELISGYKYEFWEKSSAGKMVGVTKGGEGSQTVRFINGYPFTPHTMDKLFKASDDFVLITGDQSLTEAISNKKLFLYQTMSWKSELWVNLLKLTRDTLGSNSKLFLFLKMQGVKSQASHDDIIQFLIANKQALLQDMEKLHQHIFAEKNLYTSLPAKLVSYILNPEMYIEDCFKKSQEPMNYQEVKNLIDIYPDKVEIIISLLIRQDKFKGGINELIKAINQDQALHNTATHQSIRHAIYQTCGKEVASKLVPQENQLKDAIITGIVTTMIIALTAGLVIAFSALSFTASMVGVFILPFLSIPLGLKLSTLISSMFDNGEPKKPGSYSPPPEGFASDNEAFNQTKERVVDENQARLTHSKNNRFFAEARQNTQQKADGTLENQPTIGRSGVGRI